jgi:hypothetical protein
MGLYIGQNMMLEIDITMNYKYYKMVEFVKMVITQFVGNLDNLRLWSII